MVESMLLLVVTLTVCVLTLICFFVLLSMRRMDRLNRHILKDHQYQLTSLETRLSLLEPTGSNFEEVVVSPKKKRGRPKKIIAQ